MVLNQALICAWRLSHGHAEALGGELLSDELPSGSLWVHLDRTQPGLEDWLIRTARIPNHIVSALLQEDTRPRCEVSNSGILINLRGINFNEGEMPEDMLSLRAWLSSNLLITLRSRPLVSVQALRERLEDGTGPQSLGNLLVSIAAGLAERVAARTEELSTQLEELEELSFRHRPLSLEPISDIRASVVRLRRFTRPQLQAMQNLEQANGPLLGESDQAFLRNAVDNIQRIVEMLDELLERASILRDDINNDLSGRMSRNMYTFTLLAGIFLPLGFITGLLGVNVAGIPGAQTSDAFWVLCASLALILFIEIWLLRRLKMWRD